MTLKAKWFWVGWFAAVGTRLLIDVAGVLVQRYSSDAAMYDHAEATRLEPDHIGQSDEDRSEGAVYPPHSHEAVLGSHCRYCGKGDVRGTAMTLHRDNAGHWPQGSATKLNKED